jgi:hypothetical protein
VLSVSRARRVEVRSLLNSAASRYPPCCLWVKVPPDATVISSPELDAIVPLVAPLLVVNPRSLMSCATSVGFACEASLYLRRRLEPDSQHQSVLPRPEHDEVVGLPALDQADVELVVFQLESRVELDAEKGNNPEDLAANVRRQIVKRDLCGSQHLSLCSVPFPRAGPLAEIGRLWTS